MGTHPSKKFEDGVLVERAISTNLPGDPVEEEAVTGEPTKEPEPTVVRLGAKRVDSAENKAVTAAKATKKAAKK